MAIIIGKRTNLDAPIKVDGLYGVTFTSESEAHQFVVRCEQRGQELTLAGTISAKFIRADGNTIQLVGSIVDGAAVVTLAQDCYNVQGRFQLAIFNTVGNAKLCIYACVGTVQKAQSGNLIDGGSIIPDVEDLIADIQAARGTIPPTYDTLLASIAGTYDATKTYAVGDYAWYDGRLKKCIVPITTAEAWTATHWDDAVITDDVAVLKSAFDALPYDNIYDPANNTNDYYISQGSGAVVNVAGWSISDYLPITKDSDCYYKGITIPGNAPYSAFYKSDKTVIRTFKQAIGENALTDIPSDCAYVRFSIRDSDLSTFKFYLKKLATVDDVETVKADVSENANQIVTLQSKAGAGLEAFREGNYGQKIIATGTTTNGYWNVVTGDFSASDNFRTLTVDVEGNVIEYYYTGVVFNVAFVAGVVYLDASDNILGTELLGTTTGIITYADYRLQSIPNSTAKIAFGSYVGQGGTIGAKKWTSTGDVYSQLDFVITGDSIETESAGLWPVMLKNLIGFKSYTNKAVGGTCMAAIGNDYIASEARVNAMPATADIVLIGGGTNDWANNVPLGDLTNASLSVDTNFAGAIFTLITRLQIKYPNALIVFTSNQNTRSPNRHNFDNPGGWVNNLSLSAADYADMMEKVCKFTGIPYIDTNHECAINRLNYESFLLQETNAYNDTVYMHPNKAGAKRMLRVIYRWFVNNKPIV